MNTIVEALQCLFFIFSTIDSHLALPNIDEYTAAFHEPEKPPACLRKKIVQFLSEDISYHLREWSSSRKE